MFTSTYIPVNINRNTATIYSAKKLFPVEELKQAYAVLQGANIPGVCLEQGMINFDENPYLSWTIPEVYLAMECYTNAVNNGNFSFYTVNSEDGYPLLFVSKSFKNHRLLVNSFTLQTILVSNKKLVSKIASLIDKTVTASYAVNLFDTFRSIEEGSSKIVNALLIERDTDDESLVVNPIITFMSEVNIVYGYDLLEELRAVREDKTLVTDSIHFEDGHYIRHDLSKPWPPMPQDHVDNLLEMYDKLKDRKNNYIPLVDENWTTRLFVSTNFRYLINANTFECIIVNNQQLRRLLESYTYRNSITYDELSMVWMLMKSE